MNTLNNIEIEILPDTDPDLSFIDTNDPYNKQRLKDYGTKWQMLGIMATAEIKIPYKDHWILQTISSGGIWGIESDADKDYIIDEAKTELKQLLYILKKLNVNTKNFNLLANKALKEISY